MRELRDDPGMSADARAHGARVDDLWTGDVRQDDPFVDGAVEGAPVARASCPCGEASADRADPAITGETPVPQDADMRVGIDCGRRWHTVVQEWETFDGQCRLVSERIIAHDAEPRGRWLRTRYELTYHGFRFCGTPGITNRNPIPPGTIGRIVAMMFGHMAVEWTVGDRTYDTLIAYDRVVNGGFDLLTDADLEPA